MLTKGLENAAHETVGPKRWESLSQSALKEAMPNSATAALPCEDIEETIRDLTRDPRCKGGAGWGNQVPFADIALSSGDDDDAGSGYGGITRVFGQTLKARRQVREWNEAAEPARVIS